MQGYRISPASSCENNMGYSYVESGYDQCCENKVDVISLLVTLFAIGAKVVSITNIYTNSLVNAAFDSGKKLC